MPQVLVVDDDAPMLETTAELLRALGHTVTTASSAEAAFELLDATTGVDLVLMDIVMPGMSGVEAARVIAARYYPVIPVLLMTGFLGRHPLTFEALRHEAPVIAKPLNIKQLDALIRQAVDDA